MFETINNLETPKAASLLSGLNQLPGSSESSNRHLVEKIRKAELAIRKAEQELAKEIESLAENTLDKTGQDGWTVDEIALTDLRGNALFMETVRNL